MSMLDPTPLREEASYEPDPVPTGPVTKETQIIAIYGKGGSGKSFGGKPAGGRPFGSRPGGAGGKGPRPGGGGRGKRD